MINTADGRLPAPVDMVNISYRLLYIPGGPVVQDFRHQLYQVDVIRSRGHWFTEAILPETVSIETVLLKTTFSPIRQEFQPKNSTNYVPPKANIYFLSSFRGDILKPQVFAVPPEN